MIYTDVVILLQVTLVDKEIYDINKTVALLISCFIFIFIKSVKLTK